MLFSYELSESHALTFVRLHANSSCNNKFRMTEATGAEQLSASPALATDLGEGHRATSCKEASGRFKAIATVEREGQIQIQAKQRHRGHGPSLTTPKPPQIREVFAIVTACVLLLAAVANFGDITVMQVQHDSLELP